MKGLCRVQHRLPLLAGDEAEVVRGSCFQIRGDQGGSGVRPPWGLHGERLDLVQASRAQGGVALGKDGVDPPAKLLFPHLKLLLLQRGLDSPSTGGLDECSCFCTPTATCLDDKGDNGDIAIILPPIERLLVLHPLFRCHPRKLRATEVAIT
jgi:hypothetical protein